MRDDFPHVVGSVRGDRRAGDGLPCRSVPDEHAAAARSGEDPCPVERERDAQEVDGLGERLAYFGPRGGVVDPDDAVSPRP